MDPLSTGEMALRIGSAVCLGALVGLERERKHRPAGFRTMILISLGSAGFMLTGTEVIASVLREGASNNPTGSAAFGQAEISRALQGLMGGIGFLGAGAVIQNKRAVRGLTTAAAVWVTSCIGAASGMGLYKLAMMLSVATLFTLIVLERVEERYFPEPDDWDNGKKKREESDAGVGPARMRGEEPEQEVVVIRDFRE
jgi:putative Mg2+ transporter-C (MgtC) family protein